MVLSDGWYFVAVGVVWLALILLEGWVNYRILVPNTSKQVTAPE